MRVDDVGSSLRVPLLSPGVSTGYGPSEWLDRVRMGKPRVAHPPTSVSRLKHARVGSTGLSGSSPYARGRVSETHGNALG